jgi:hypothetical protein
LVFELTGQPWRPAEQARRLPGVARIAAEAPALFPGATCRIGDHCDWNLGECRNRLGHAIDNLQNRSLLFFLTLAQDNKTK